MKYITITHSFRTANFCPGCCGSVVECQPANQRVAGSILGLGHMPGLQAGSPGVGGAHKRQPHIDVSLPLFLPAFHSLK